MNILHICSDYPYTPLYQQMLLHFNDKEIHHVMYAPLMIGRATDSKYNFESSNAQVKYSYDYTRFDRFRYHHKRNKISDLISFSVDLNNIDVIHAHYLFSAGGIAYNLKKCHGIDYIVAVRNTDLNTFFKYAIHLRGFGIKVLELANRIVFISPAYRELLLENFIPAPLRNEIYYKSVVIPNGINDYWFDNVERKKRVLSSEIKFIFVGEFTKNKNIINAIKMVKLLRDRSYDAKLKIIGDGDQAALIDKLSKKYSDFLEVKGWIRSKDELRDEYRKSDIFVMPSLTETFGLVYIEALSQGLPIIYTRGQGIDGYFEEGKVGFACNPRDANSITECAEKIIRRYVEISENCINSLVKFRWDLICREYEGIYKSIGGRRKKSND